MTKTNDNCSQVVNQIEERFAGFTLATKNLRDSAETTLDEAGGTFGVTDTDELYEECCEATDLGHSVGFEGVSIYPQMNNKRTAVHAVRMLRTWILCLYKFFLARVLLFSPTL